MSIHEVKFKFIENRHPYSLPVLGVDLEFIKDRRCEIISCMRQLAKKVSEINIADENGMIEFDKANKLVRYYYFALRLINAKEEILTNGERVISKEERESQAVYMHNEMREKTR